MRLINRVALGFITAYLAATETHLLPRHREFELPRFCARARPKLLVLIKNESNHEHPSRTH